MENLLNANAAITASVRGLLAAILKKYEENWERVSERVYSGLSSLDLFDQCASHPLRRLILKENFPIITVRKCACVWYPLTKTERSDFDPTELHRPDTHARGLGMISKYSYKVRF